MKKIVSILVVALAMVSCNGNKKEKLAVNDEVEVVKTVVENNVDVTASVLTWKGTKPTGAHDGTVALKEGSLVVENGELVSGTFVVDMSTIKNLDMAGSKGAGKIEGHLKSADFFDVAVFPTSKFVITSVKNTEGKLAVTGNLTIKDVTKSITIPATMSDDNGVITFKSDVFNLNRADFNVKYGSKSFFDNLKDKFIDDIIEMSFEVKTKA